MFKFLVIFSVGMNGATNGIEFETQALDGAVLHAVDYRENLYGERVIDREVIVRQFGRGYKIVIRELNCTSAASLGLGICQCESHPTYWTTVYFAQGMDVYWTDNGLTIQFSQPILLKEGEGDDDE